MFASAANEDVRDKIHQVSGNRINSDTTIDNLLIKVDVFNLIIPPPSSGVQFYRDGIIFLSSSKSDGKMLPGHMSFGTIDTRYAVLKDSLLAASEIFSSTSSFPYPSEGITFSMDYKSMYFTKYSKSDGCEKIYQARYSEGDQPGWSANPDPVSFCSDNSTYSHPALSADGKILVYASNRPGSVGGMDLYASLEKDGKWSDPVNLGDAVNSSFNELYPFLDSENNLFFSSDNIQGFGGYDIYVCKFKSNTWEKPINLSSPVNTRFDDVAFTINRKDGKSAFYTVKQNSGKGSMQLYRITFNQNKPDDLLTLSQYYTRPDISNMVILALEPAVQATDKISETATPKRSVSGKDNDDLVYRVQFLTSFNPKTRSQITISGKEYSVFEYLYSGAYRLCVGEFKVLPPALELQKKKKKNDYPNASVVVFRNNVLALEPELLKSPVNDAQEPSGAQMQTSKPAETELKPSVTVPVSLKQETPTPEAKKPETVKASVPDTTASKNVAVKSVNPVATENKDKVVYRVQLFSGGTGGSTKVTIDNKPYMTYEYKYNGVYRTCVGEFSSLNPAKELQNSSRKAGFTQAFVVAFKNNIRSTDPALFK